MRKKLVLVALTLATILYFAYFVYRSYCYSQLPTTGEDPELGTFFIFPKPFLMTSEGARLLRFGLPLAVAWVVATIFFCLKTWKEDGEMVKPELNASGGVPTA